MPKNATVALIVFVAMTMSGCGKDEKKKDMGKAQVGFANGTTAGLHLDTPAGSTGTESDLGNGKTYPTYQPSTYALKLVQIYLNEDVAADGWTNSGTNAYIWINPVCGTETSDDGAITMANNGNCDTTQISSFFELARSTDEVNADLNAQQIPIPAQTYRYIRLQLCDNQIPDKNIKVASTTGGLTTATTLRTGNCVIPPVKIDPPLEIGKDETVKVSLKYDLSQALADYDYDMTTGVYNTDSDGNPSCAPADSGKGLRCLRDITFSATATK